MSNTAPAKRSSREKKETRAASEIAFDSAGLSARGKIFGRSSVRSEFEPN